MKGELRFISILWLMLVCTIALHAVRAKQSHEIRKYVRVNGHRLYVRCDGRGLPVVVLEAGLDANSASFSAVQPDVARFTTVCSYDRLNLGQSEHADGVRTSQASVDDLHVLLTELKLRKPYVLVGASMGGIIVRIFAQRYPDESAGIVLLDSTPEDLVARYSAVLTSEQLIQTFAGKNIEQIDVKKSLSEALATRWRRDIPLLVLTHDPALGRPPIEREQAWEQMQAELATRSDKGKLRIVYGSSHVMTRDKPQAIVHAIYETVMMVRSQ